MMQIIPLQSGSNGNSVYVEANGVKLLFDAGISGKQAEARLWQFGKDIRDVNALIVSHDHSDHSKCIGIFNRKFSLPVYVTRDTLSAARQQINVGQINELRFFRPGLPITFGDVVVETVPTPHDGADGSVFVVDDGKARLGIMTDLGHVNKDFSEVIETVDGVYLESNYDPDRLENGSYPYFLKRRIMGPGGHVSNAEAVTMIKKNANGRLKWLCLAHLSEENNTPDLAIKTARSILGKTLPIHVAKRYEASGILEL